MRLNEFIRNNRKAKYPSVNQFLDETNLDMPTASYYAIEKGAYSPKSADLYKIIKALKLNVKYTYTLWLQEQLPENNLKKYFPLPTINEDQDEEVIKFNPDITQTISKSHIKYLATNRLSRLLLMYLYANSSAAMTIKDIHEEFKKHSLKNVKKALNDLIDKGYIYEPEKDKYRSNNRYLYLPKTEEFRELQIANAKDICEFSNWHTSLNTPYGKYQKGFFNYHSRTLSAEQFDYIKDIMTQLYNESVKLPPTAGQEYFVLTAIGALDEK